MLGSTSPAIAQRAIGELRAEARREADETAQKGVEQARTLGLAAEPVTAGPSAPAWAALLDAAHRLGAHVLICGTRGRGAFARALLDSTSSSLLHTGGHRDQRCDDQTGGHVDHRGRKNYKAVPDRPG